MADLPPAAIQRLRAAVRTALAGLAVAPALAAQDPDLLAAAQRAAARAEDRRTSYAAESGPVDIARSPNQIRIFDAEDLATSGARTVGEFLLKELPGQILAPGGPGLPARPYLGGSRPQDTAVLLDGLRLGDASSLGVDLNTIPLLGLERIEVIIGPLSSRHGNQAQGGAIALFSAAGRGSKGFGELTGAGGGGGAARTSATPGWAWGSGWVQGGGVNAREDQATPTDRPYRQTSTLFGVGQTFGAATLSFSYRNHFQGVPDPYRIATALERENAPGRESTFRSEGVLAGLKWSLAPGLAFGVDLAASRLHRTDPTDPGVVPAAYDDHRLQVLASLSFALFRFASATLFVDALQDRVDLPAAPGGRGGASGKGVGAGLELAFDLHPRLRLTGDLRQQWDTQTLRPLATGPESQRSTSRATWRLAANLALPGGFRAYAAGGVGASTPLLAQLLQPGATPLADETSHYALLGLGWAEGNFYTRLEAQQSRHLSPIVPTVGGFANGADLRFQGAEGTLGWRNRRKLGVEGFVRSQEGRDFGAAVPDQLRTSNVQGRPFATRGLRTWLGAGRYRIDIQTSQIGRRYEAVGTYNCNTLAPQVVTTGAVFNDVTITQTLTLGRWILIWRMEHLLQPSPELADWLARNRDARSDAYRIYGYPVPGPRSTFEARYRF